MIPFFRLIPDARVIIHAANPDDDFARHPFWDAEDNVDPPARLRGRSVEELLGRPDRDGFITVDNLQGELRVPRALLSGLPAETRIIVAYSRLPENKPGPAGPSDRFATEISRRKDEWRVARAAANADAAELARERAFLDEIAATAGGQIATSGDMVPSDNAVRIAEGVYFVDLRGIAAFTAGDSLQAKS